jgi:uncharacterized protein YecT (DUF1311 family)
MRALLAVLLLAAPAAAPGAAEPTDRTLAEAAALETCAEQAMTAAPGAPVKAAADDCIGIIARQCIAAPGGETTVGRNDCLSREAAAWDVVLNRDWPQLLDAMARRDAANEVDRLGLRSARAELRAAQRAWLAFREADCTAQSAEWGTGTIGSTVFARCWLEMTARRTIDLHARLLAAP